MYLPHAVFGSRMPLLFRCWVNTPRCFNFWQPGASKNDTYTILRHSVTHGIPELTFLRATCITEFSRNGVCNLRTTYTCTKTTEPLICGAQRVIFVFKQQYWVKRLNIYTQKVCKLNIISSILTNKKSSLFYIWPLSTVFPPYPAMD